jgi:hypothetical protein
MESSLDRLAFHGLMDSSTGEKEMRSFAALIAASTLAACAQTTAGDEAEPSSRYTFWRPAPVEAATEPADVIARSTAADWRAIDPDN